MKRRSLKSSQQSERRLIEALSAVHLAPASEALAYAQALTEHFSVAVLLTIDYLIIRLIMTQTVLELVARAAGRSIERHLSLSP